MVHSKSKFLLEAPSCPPSNSCSSPSSQRGQMAPTRPSSTYSTPSSSLTPDPLRPPFELPSKDRSYKQQYANLYWLRLAVLRAKVEKRARDLWEELEGELLLGFVFAGGLGWMRGDGRERSWKRSRRSQREHLDQRLDNFCHLRILQRDVGYFEIAYFCR